MPAKENAKLKLSRTLNDSKRLKKLELIKQRWTLSIGDCERSKML